MAGAAVLAMVSGGGAVASGLIGSEEIRDGSISKPDIGLNAVGSAEVKDGSLGLPDFNDHTQKVIGRALVPGTQGTKGESGAKGEPGAAGADGKNGLDGAPGPMGPQGDPGVAGSDGEDGAPGPMGLTGNRGPAGERGAPGPQGLPGEKGAPGETGADGVQGPAGPPGPMGMQGPPGVSGREFVTRLLQVPANETASMTAPCSLGKRALGGGYRQLTGAYDSNVYENGAIGRRFDYYYYGEDGWRVSVANNDVAPVEFEVQVICANAEWSKDPYLFP